MKRCVKCRYLQALGNFCQSCGGILQEVKFDKPDRKINYIETTRNKEKIQHSIKRLLERLGCKASDVRFIEDDYTASVEYILDKKTYNFNSFLQKKMSDNWAAVEQFIQGRVLGIERGIETTEKAFKGYEALPNYSAGVSDPYHELGFEQEVSLDEAKSRYKQIAKECHPDVVKDAIKNARYVRAAKAFSEIEEREKTQ